MGQHLCLVLETLDQYRVRLGDRRASTIIVQGIRIGLAVLRRWLICLQHQIDVTRDGMGRGTTHEASSLLMPEDVAPVGSSSVTICTSLHHVLVQLQSMPATLATARTTSGWTTSTEDPINVDAVEAVEQWWSRQLRSGLRSVERYLTKIRIVALTLSDRLDWLEHKEAHQRLKRLEARRRRDRTKRTNTIHALHQRR